MISNKGKFGKHNFKLVFGRCLLAASDERAKSPFEIKVHWV